MGSRRQDASEAEEGRGERPDPLLSWLGRDGRVAQRKEGKGTGARPRPTLSEAARLGVRGWLRLVGPGIVSGAADDDPSAIATYAQTGAQSGYGLLWTGLFAAPLMMAVQELAQRIALQTGAGLGRNLTRRFPSGLVGAAVALLVVSNVVVLGADLQAAGSGIRLLAQGHLPATVSIGVVAVALVGFQIRGSYDTLYRAFKWFTIPLLAYVATVFVAHPKGSALLRSTFVPHVEGSRTFLLNLVAVLGTTLSPYLYFWQPAQEVDVIEGLGRRPIDRRQGVSRQHLRAARTDTFIGMFFSQLVAYCIMATTAASLNGHHRAGIQTAGDAARALRPLAGPAASVLFAIGFVGTALLAVPVLSASAAYAVNEAWSIPGSLREKPSTQPTFYAVIVITTGLGVGMDLLHINVIQALVVASAAAGVAAVPLLVLMTVFGADRGYMADRASGRLSRTLTWASAAGMTLAAVALLVATVA